MIGLLAPLADTLIKRIFPDKVAQDKAKLEFNAMLLDGTFKEFEKQAEVIISEAKSSHKITATWRPITMLTFVAIIANNYIIYPYLALFWPDAPVLEIPPDMWQLLKIGLGGYVVGRSMEKSISTWKGN